MATDSTDLISDEFTFSLNLTPDTLECSLRAKRNKVVAGDICFHIADFVKEVLDSLGSSENNTCSVEISHKDGENTITVTPAHRT